MRLNSFTIIALYLCMISSIITGIQSSSFMSQDLSSDPLVASPESQIGQTPRLDDVSGSTAIGQDGYNEFTIHRQEGRQFNAQHLRANRAKVNERNDLHPYTQTLSLSDLDSCVALENAVFPETERCSKEKVAPPRSYSILIHFYLEPSICIAWLCLFIQRIDLTSTQYKSSFFLNLNHPHSLPRPDHYQSFFIQKFSDRKPPTYLSSVPAP